MNRFSRYLIAALTLPLILAPGAFAAEQIGKALAITVTVSKKTCAWSRPGMGWPGLATALRSRQIVGPPAHDLPHFDWHVRRYTTRRRPCG